MEGRGTGTRGRLSVRATVMWLYIACVAVVEVRGGRRRRDAGSKERLNGVTRLSRQRQLPRRRQTLGLDDGDFSTDGAFERGRRA